MSIIREIHEAWLSSEMMKKRIIPTGIAISEEGYERVKEHVIAMSMNHVENVAFDMGLFLALPGLNEAVKVYPLTYGYNSIGFIL